MTARSSNAQSLLSQEKTDWDQRSYVYPCGVELYHQGQTLNEAFYVVNGTVKLTHVDSDWRESLVALAMPSEWFGTAAIIANAPTPTSAITCSRSLLSSCPATTFRRLLQDDRRFSAALHEAHARESFRQVHRVCQLCSHNSRTRLLSVLCRFAAVSPPPRGGTAVKLRLPLHHWEVAEFIGVTPEHLSRLLKDLERAGIIRRENGWIIVADRTRLLAEPADLATPVDEPARAAAGGRRVPCA